MTKAGLDYLKEVDQQLSGKRAQRKAYIKKLSADVAERLEEEPALDCAALANAFGSPEELASEFMETLNAKDVKKAFGWKKIVLIAAIVIIVVWIFWVVIALIDGHKQSQGQIVEYYGEELQHIEIEGSGKP